MLPRDIEQLSPQGKIVIVSNFFGIPKNQKKIYTMKPKPHKRLQAHPEKKDITAAIYYFRCGGNGDIHRKGTIINSLNSAPENIN